MLYKYLNIIIEEIHRNEIAISNNETIEKLETKVKEYDCQINLLNSQINEKEYNISLFVKEMNDLLEAYEKINGKLYNYPKLKCCRIKQRK